MTMRDFENLLENVFYGFSFIVVVAVGAGFFHMYNEIGSLGAF